MTSRPPGAGTRAARGGEGRKKALDAVTQPIVCTATYAFDDTAEIHDHFEGRIRREEYGRYGNPTVRTAERKIAELDGAEDCALFAKRTTDEKRYLFNRLAADYAVWHRIFKPGLIALERAGPDGDIKKLGPS